MTVEYVNRMEQRYFLFEGRTKSGKPKYYCSRKPSASGVPAEAMPLGFEWRENPVDGIVSVRKVRPSRIASFEREMLAEGIRTVAGLRTFIIDVDGDSLVTYLPDRNPDALDSIFGSLMGTGGAQSMGAWTAKFVHYSPMMRFALQDENERLFSVERWCFRGSMDAWMYLQRPAPLAAQIKRYVPHLGQESFFELI